jgi:hypothetical protein
MTQVSVAARMEQAIRTYIEACNAADADGIARCFDPDAEHYFPTAPKWSGSELIAANFARVVTERGRAWTVDQVVIDEHRHCATFEWTQSDRPPRILRGVDWVVFARDTLRFKEIRSYFAVRSDPEAACQQLRDFDYGGRGYSNGTVQRR